jgi:hypothetical protein
MGTDNKFQSFDYVHTKLNVYVFIPEKYIKAVPYTTGR